MMTQLVPREWALIDPVTGITAAVTGASSIIAALLSAPLGEFDQAWELRYGLDFSDRFLSPCLDIRSYFLTGPACGNI